MTDRSTRDEEVAKAVLDVAHGLQLIGQGLRAYESRHWMILLHESMVRAVARGCTPEAVLRVVNEMQPATDIHDEPTKRGRTKP